MSGYLLEMNPDSCIIVDCGEGTFGQLKVLFHDRLDALLRSLHMVLITHAHQDHCFGLYSIVQERQRAFERAGWLFFLSPYRSLSRNIVYTNVAWMQSECHHDIQCLQHSVQ